MKKNIHIRRLLVGIFAGLFFLSANGQRTYLEAEAQGDDAFEQGEYIEAIIKYGMALDFNGNTSDPRIQAKINLVYFTIDSVLQENDQKIEEAIQKESEAGQVQTDSLLLQLTEQKEYLVQISERVQLMADSMQQVNEEKRVALADKKLLTIISDFDEQADSALKEDSFKAANRHYDHILDAIEEFTGSDTLAESKKKTYLQKKATLTEFIQFYHRGDSLLKTGALSDAYQSFLSLNKYSIANGRLQEKTREAEELFPKYWKQLRKEGQVPPLIRLLNLSAESNALSGEMKKAKSRLAKSIRYGFSTFSDLAPPELRDFANRYHRWYRYLARLKLRFGMQSIFGRQSSKPMLTVYDGEQGIRFDRLLNSEWGIREFGLLYSPFKRLELGITVGFSPGNAPDYIAEYSTGNSEINFREPFTEQSKGILGQKVYQSYFVLIKVYDSNKKWPNHKLNSFNLKLLLGWDVFDKYRYESVKIYNPEATEDSNYPQISFAKSYYPSLVLYGNTSSNSIRLEPDGGGRKNLFVGLQCNGYPFRTMPNISFYLAIRRRFAVDQPTKPVKGNLNNGLLLGAYDLTRMEQQHVEDYVSKYFALPIEVSSLSSSYAWSVNLGLAYEF